MRNRILSLCLALVLPLVHAGCTTTEDGRTSLDPLALSSALAASGGSVAAVETGDPELDASLDEIGEGLVTASRLAQAYALGADAVDEDDLIGTVDAVLRAAEAVLEQLEAGSSSPLEHQEARTYLVAAQVALHAIRSYLEQTE